jgi:AcrR family transcriptional regulator
MAIEARYGGILAAALDVFARRGFHQASMRRIASAAGLSLAGLYHYVGGKEDLLFLVLDRSLRELLGRLDEALAHAPTPEDKLLALIRTHLDFGFDQAQALKVINRDWELLPEPRRTEVAAKRGEYLQRGMAILREIDPHDCSGDELLSATNLLLGMLNGIATRPFVRSGAETSALADRVGALFLHGFLRQDRPVGGAQAALSGGEHDR